MVTLCTTRMLNWPLGRWPGAPHSLSGSAEATS